MRTLVSYLRWLKSVMRRIQDDVALDLRRQEWWARGVSIAPTAIIRLGADAVLEIGEGSIIGHYSILDLTPDPQLGERAQPSLTIGRRTAINEFNNIRAGNAPISIGDDSLISQFVTIIDANHGFARGTSIRDQPHSLDSAGICIGDDVWIGAHAVILPGLRIGNGAVIAAGAVVTCDVPAYAVAAGIPAGVKRYRE
jgi:carbonic anhydrase/acetyltransferase-like protein (isoleucine patch superfamily)